MGVAQWRTTEADELEIRRRMDLAGEDNRSQHFRRVYMEGAGDYERVVGEMRQEMARQADTLNELRLMVRRLVEKETSDVELKMMAALFMLIYPSVEEAVQQDIEKYIDPAVIKSFLTGDKKGGKIK